MVMNGRTFSFGIAMKFWLTFLSGIITVNAFAQQRAISGIVFDKDTKDRIASVSVRNLTTGISNYNSLTGEFRINAHIGDQLIFSRQYYYTDTIKVKSDTALAIYMRRMAIQLNQVTIRDSLPNPEKRLAVTKKAYSKVYGSLAYDDLLSSAPGGGAGVSIDALYNLFSNSGRNAARLRETIENDYRQNVIDYRFNKAFVGSITGLKDYRLADFMQKYRPGYYLTKNSSDYEFISSIKANLKRYLRNPRIYTLPPLTGK
jgi:hypothetical protein